ncbi:uncharacterized protein LOC129757857 [Uranotaenia lowii]|uniref:uncharacterized protein LOC129757857 n=1 Tax=Uranotaenia lowii TaxID=190385 RepID=UPI00247AD96D|nr:uncharacterized protein LOC129757857 [Uranotaenia lowii]
MSSENDSTSSSAAAGSSASGSSTDFSQIVPEQSHSLAQRMLLHVYRTSGIAAARQLPFWENFRSREMNIRMSARDLRTMFFSEVLLEPEHFYELPYATVQYLNPQFNIYQPEVLDFGDLAEGEDFQLNVPHQSITEDFNPEDLVRFVSIPIEAERNLDLPPADLDLVHNPPKPPTEEEELAKQFARMLSELVWTEEETVEKPILDIPELRERMLNLAKAGVSIQDLLQPGVQARDLLATQQSGKIVHVDQQVPEVPKTIARTILKRCKSLGDSGIGSSPKKRTRLFPTSSSRRGEALRRTFSTPANDSPSQ